MRLPDNTAGQRLDYVLSELTEYSRVHIQQMIKAGEIQLEQQTVKPSYRVLGGEEVFIPTLVVQPTELSQKPSPWIFFLKMNTS